MARAELEDRWEVAADIDAVRRRVVRFLDRTGWSVEDEDDEIEAKQGSHVWTRLFGAWFVSDKTLPKWAAVTLREGDGRVRVRAVIEERWGFGIFDPVTRDKYEAFFERWMDDLTDATRG